MCVQGIGKINGQPLTSPKMIRFHELTEDEYFCSEAGREWRDVREHVADGTVGDACGTSGRGRVPWRTNHRLGTRDSGLGTRDS